MSRHLHLVSDTERQAVLDALRRCADRGQLSPAELSARTARVHAAQSHAGLDSVLLDLPPEPPKLPKLPKLPKSTPTRQPTRRVVRRVEWQLQTVVVSAAVVLAGFITAVYAARNNEDPVPQVVAPSPTFDLPLASTTSVPLPTTTPPQATLPGNPRRVLLRVGQDMEPGRYMSIADALCYWERVRGVSGEDADVIANGLGPRAVVDVMASDVGLASSNCGIWRPYAPLPAPKSTASDGDWLVGNDVEPGRYDVPGGHLCQWERGRGFAQHPLDDVIENGHPEGPSTVTLLTGERLSTRDCGTWTKVG